MQTDRPFGRRRSARNDQPREQPERSGRGDYRGAYGYGRPAHGSDPRGKYGFPASAARDPKA